MKKKRILYCIIITLAAIFSANFIGNLIYPNYQFAINIESENNHYISFGTRNDFKKEIPCKKNKCQITIEQDIIGKKLLIEYSTTNNHIDEFKVNNEKVKLNQLNTFNIDRYNNLFIFSVDRYDNKNIVSKITIFIIIEVVLLFIFYKKHFSFIYDKNILKIIKKRDIIITTIIILLTIFLVCGCDAKIIVNVLQWFHDKIDIYQLQVNSKNLLDTIYAEYPYNPLSLEVFGSITNLVYNIFYRIPMINNYPYFQVFVLKFINLLFVQLTTISLLSFLYKNKKVSEKKVRTLYYLTIFNPILFYVAFLFVQLDTLTMYLLTIGLIYLSKLKENNYIGVLFFTLGLTIKLQLIVLLPLLIILIIKLSYEENCIKYMKRFFISSLLFFIIFIIFFALNYMLKTPAYILLSNLKQSERIWYTIIQYMGDTHIYLSVLGIGLLMYIFVFNIGKKVSENNLIKGSIVFIMSLIFILSATIVPTPSIYIVAIPAFLVIMYDTDNNLYTFILYILSFLIILLPMFSDYGDITLLISGINNKSYLQEFMNKLEYKDYIKINNIIFTISMTSMVAYTIEGMKKTLTYIKGEEK